MHIVLVAPEIAPNVGNVARLCAATNSTLHLVRPLGFHLDDKRMRRAGLDYWPHVELRVHDSLEQFFAEFPTNECYFVSTKGSKKYSDIKYSKNDILLFGSEGSGLPEQLLNNNADRVITIPMIGPVRSLNLSTAVAIVLYEGLRQLTN